MAESIMTESSVNLITGTRRRRWRARDVQFWSLAILLALMVLAVIILPLIYQADPNEQNLRQRLIAPFTVTQAGLSPLGTDALGRDTLARLLSGMRVSMAVGVLSVLIGVVVGSALGLLAGYFGGLVDTVLMRLMDMQMSIPFLILVLIMSAILGPGIRNTILALGITSWITYARLIRAETLTLRTREFVESARSLGSTDLRILLRHIFPNLVDNLIVVGTLEVGRMILTEASLSFLGLGVQPPQASLGKMVADGQQYVFKEWWVTAIPSITIFGLVLLVSLFGDAVRDKIDPNRT